MSEHTDTPDRGLGRREVIAGGAAGLGAVILGSRAVAAARAAVPPTARLSAGCVLSPEMTEGPYWIDEDLTRRDVTEDIRGMPLILRLTVVRASSCRPIGNADVEIWHAEGDPRGLPHPLLPVPRPGRDVARGRHDLPARRLPLDAADPAPLGRPTRVRRPPRAGRQDLTGASVGARTTRGCIMWPPRGPGRAPRGRRPSRRGAARAARASPRSPRPGRPRRRR
jgi:hypothetical protein